MSQPVSVEPRVLRGFRRGAVIGIIVSLSITALIGIATLLTGEFGETQGRVLLTTMLMAAFSITALCHLAVVGRALRVVGYVGIAVSAAALVAGVVLIWREDGRWDDLLKAFLVLSVLSVGFAHANLLLLLGERRHAFLRGGMLVTVAFVAGVAILVIVPIVTDGRIPGENGDPYWRLLGVVGILDVLGSIALPVASRFLPDEPRRAARHVEITLRISPELGARLDAVAAARSTSREQVVLDALETLPPP